jgi:hypothetical protein
VAGTANDDEIAVEIRRGVRFELAVEVRGFPNHPTPPL